MPKAYLSLGSNQEPEYHLAAAVQALRDTFGTVVLSDWVRTRAVGFDGPDFINGAAIMNATLQMRERLKPVVLTLAMLLLTVPSARW